MRETKSIKILIKISGNYWLINEKKIKILNLFKEKFLNFNRKKMKKKKTLRLTTKLHTIKN